jgi:tRNA-modifying protein YgfZ
VKWKSKKAPFTHCRSSDETSADMNTTSTTVQVGQLQHHDYAALEAARLETAVVELGELPTLVVKGPDRLTWLNGLLTCDVTGVKPGHGAWGLLLDRLGKIQAVLGVLADAQHLYLGVLWGNVEAVAKELDARLVMEDAELAPAESEAFWRLRVGRQVPGFETGAQASGVVTLAGNSSLSVALGAALPAGDVAVLSPAAWQAFRIRHGLPWGGVDFDDAERPHEAALERRAVSWSKGCYLGQEVVCMQDMRGKVKRSVRPFTVHAATGPESDAASNHVLQGAKAVGRVTSAVYDPQGARYWVLAQVPLAALTDGALASESMSGTDTDLTWTPTTGAAETLHLVEPTLEWVE